MISIRSNDTPPLRFSQPATDMNLRNAENARDLRQQTEATEKSKTGPARDAEIIRRYNNKQKQDDISEPQNVYSGSTEYLNFVDGHKGRFCVLLFGCYLWRVLPQGRRLECVVGDSRKDLQGHEAASRLCETDTQNTSIRIVSAHLT